MTYEEAIRYLYGLRLTGAKFGLEQTNRLAELAGNPQLDLQFIHVAGTNGKGSTCAVLESIYREAGLRVGLYTSPHLVSFRERIQVNKELISQAKVASLTAKARELILSSNSTVEDSKTGERTFDPTFFEVVTVMALCHFLDERCDLIIWETGLGGRLDATNIVTPLASVITNVQLDHCQWLGNSHAEIAHEKAGIIKREVPCFTATSNPHALEVIQRIAAERDSRLEVIHEEMVDAVLANLPSPALKGAHQRLNSALAVKVVRGLINRISVNDISIGAGLEKVRWPGRFDIISKSYEGCFVVDAAHNPDGIETLMSSMEAHFPGVEADLILGVLEDKDWQRMCHRLAARFRIVHLPPVKSQRALSQATLQHFFNQFYPHVIAKIHRSVREALEASSGSRLTVIAGSMYLTGESLALLRPKAEDESHRLESGLNEWGAFLR